MKRTLLLSVLILAGCGGGGVPPAPTPILCESPLLLNQVNQTYWSGIPLVAAWNVSSDVVGFSVGSHPAWMKWELDRTNQRILLTGTPTADGIHQITFTLGNLCGKSATVAGGSLVIRRQP